MYTLGIDAGSTMCKLALLHHRNIIDTSIVPAGWNARDTATIYSRKMLDTHQINASDCHIATTGYGRESIDFADHSITEISAHAYGGCLLVTDIVGIIDIGGQDSKIIILEDNRPKDFLMNDKCAAGTGRFLEMACEKLNVPIDAIDDFIHTRKSVEISSMCAVFAESEIISHLANAMDRAEILNGVIQSIGEKIISMVGRISSTQGAFLMTGGLSRSIKVAEAIEASIHRPVKRHPLSPFAGAIGAALSMEM